MGSVHRGTYTKPLPDRAELFTPLASALPPTSSRSGSISLRSKSGSDTATGFRGWRLSLAGARVQP